MTATASAQATRHDRPDTREMVIVHNVFRRLFGDLPRLVREVGDGDTDRAAVLADLFLEIGTGLHHHHTNEDDYLWPLLLSRVTVDRGYVLRAEEQHERAHEALERALGLVNVFRLDASPEHREAFAVALERLDAVLREHMADEEAYVLPLVEQHLTVAEWEVLGERGREGMPKDRLLVQLGWILDGIPEADQRSFLAGMPLPARLAWRLVGRRAFRRERAMVYGA